MPFIGNCPAVLGCRTITAKHSRNGTQRCIIVNCPAGFCAVAIKRSIDRSNVPLLKQNFYICHGSPFVPGAVFHKSPPNLLNCSTVIIYGAAGFIRKILLKTAVYLVNFPCIINNTAASFGRIDRKIAVNGFHFPLIVNNTAKQCGKILHLRIQQRKILSFAHTESGMAFSVNQITAAVNRQGGTAGFSQIAGHFHIFGYLNNVIALFFLQFGL